MGAEPGAIIGAIELELLVRKRAGVEVYEGHHVRLGIDVDVHVMTGAPADDRDRFLREARIVADFGHPLVVPVLDFGEYDDLRALVTERVGGQTLEHHMLVHGGRLSERGIVALLERVGRLLGEAHEAGFAHRDLSSSHICVDPAGRLRVTGFALVPERGLRLPERGPAREEAARYLPPEGMRAEGVRHPSCDLFALGVIAYELAFQRLPYPSGAADAPEAAPLDLPTHCSDAVVAVIGALIDPDPRFRVRSGEELVKMLPKNPARPRSSDTDLATAEESREPNGLAEGSDADHLDFQGIARFLQRWFGRSRSSHSAGVVLHSSLRERLLVWVMLIGLIAVAIAGMRSG